MMPLHLIQLETERAFGFRPGDLRKPEYKRIRKYTYAKSIAVYVSHKLFHHTYRHLKKHYGMWFHGTACYVKHVQDLLNTHDTRTLELINTILENLPAYGEPGFMFMNEQACSFRSWSPGKPKPLASLPDEGHSAPAS